VYSPVVGRGKGGKGHEGERCGHLPHRIKKKKLTCINAGEKEPPEMGRR